MKGLAFPNWRPQNGLVRLDLRNRRRQRLFTVHIDPKRPPAVVRSPDGQGSEVHLNWDQTLDEQRHLQTCPVCGCNELFVRKNFSQPIGLAVVVAAIAVAVVLFTLRLVWAGFAVLAVTTTVDALIYMFTRRCVVCYRCRSEASQLPIRSDHPGWSLATGEKYRPPPELHD